MSERSVNKVILLGRLGRDAETKFIPDGTAVTKFSIATSKRVKGKESGEWGEKTEWHNCVLWRAENVSPHLVKGKQVYIEGHLETRSWEDAKTQAKRYATEVVCDELILLGGNSGEASTEARPPRSTAPIPPADDLGINDDDVPF